MSKITTQNIEHAINTVVLDQLVEDAAEERGFKLDKSHTYLESVDFFEQGLDGGDGKESMWELVEILRVADRQWHQMASNGGYTNVNNSIKYAIYQYGVDIFGVGESVKEAKIEAIKYIEDCEDISGINELLEHDYGRRISGEFYLTRITEKLYFEIQEDGSMSEWDELDDDYDTLCTVGERVER